ncbi:metallophosphoesterase [Halosegnis longus]|uniref:metallophosphoesterase n=1 Tax=Halosegnis longus TaxID=2216012 RepID=UPI00096A664B|nr:MULTISPECIES: metallophosphoesterase [Halobacteriales]
MDDRVSSVDSTDSTPPIVHISDIHGYLSDARSALQALDDTDEFAPIVTQDADGTLHWADNDYVLVVNGDVVDRGPRNEDCVALVRRLQAEAPAGRVRYHIGNHEMGILLPDIFHWPNTYSTSLAAEKREDFLRYVTDGWVSAAYDGYSYTYTHAGSNDAVAAAELNQQLIDAATQLLDAGSSLSETAQREYINEYPDLFGLGGSGGRGPGAGICWLDFEHLDPGAPSQIVGHSMREYPVRNGNVVCGNIIRLNHERAGGEGVIVEEPDGLTAVTRRPDASVKTAEL